jgi:hypothetical protein
MSVHFLVQNPGVCRTGIKEGSNLLWRIVTNVEVSNVREIQMVIQMKTKTSAALLTVVVEFALVHVSVFFIKLLSQGWTLLLAFFHFDIVSHVLWEKVVVQILLPSFKRKFDSVRGIKLRVCLY